MKKTVIHGGGQAGRVTKAMCTGLQGIGEVITSKNDICVKT